MNGREREVYAEFIGLIGLRDCSGSAEQLHRADSVGTGSVPVVHEDPPAAVPPLATTNDYKGAWHLATEGPAVIRFAWTVSSGSRTLAG